ncbi:BTAD domain-containing putative transcriptional regulator [Aeromicrobium panaciterrae]
MSANDPEGTIMNDIGTEPRSTDPARFAAGRFSEQSVQRSTGETIGAALALMALVIGIPAILLVLSGPPPLPTGAPSMRDFAKELSFDDLLAVLVGVVWLAWAYFVICVVVEAAAARRGGVARSLPLAGPVQTAARLLVGAVLLTGLIAGPAQAASGPSTSSSPVAAAATEVTPAPVTPDVSEPVAVSDSATKAADQMVGSKVYVVKAPKDGYHDNLWDIAENHLGDGRRYTEIFELNKDRIQHDGQTVDLARLIQPGWEFVMPDDATGVPVIQATPVAPVTPAAPVDTPTSSADAVDHATDVAGVESTPWWAGAGLLAAGIVGSLALRRRRRLGRDPEDDALDVESDLRIAATHARSGWVDQVLRRLARECREQGIEPPPAYGATVDDDSIELLLSPAVPQAAEGWTAIDGGRRWRCERTDHESVEHGTVPYPALVSLGVDTEGRDVMLDLEAAGGVISISGDPAMASQVATSIAVQAATSPWTDQLRVISSGIPASIGEIGDARITVVDDLNDDLDRIEEQIVGLRQDVLTGRMSRRGFVPSTVLVLGESPEAELAVRLGALAGAARQAFSIVVAGEHRASRWRLTVDEHGILSAPSLELTLHASRIGPAQLEAVAELFTATLEVGEPDTGQRVTIAAPQRTHDDADWSTAPRRVGVLGPIGVDGAGDLTPDRTDVATEMVVYLAMHPEGVHPNVLGGIVWPRGVTPDVRDAGISRARAWLGTDAEGNHNLRSDADGRLSLAPSVVCDWDVARNLLLESRRASSAGDEADLLRRGLGMVRGEPFAKLPEGRFGWIVRDGLPRAMVNVIADAALRLCALLGDDPGGVASAAEAGLRINPGNQELWRELIRARSASSGVAGVRLTLDEMGVALYGIALDAETEALVDELMPDTGTLATSG